LQVSGYDPGDVFFAAPATYASENRAERSVEIVLRPYFKPSPGYWDVIEVLREGQTLILVGRLSCLVTPSAVAKMVDRAGEVLLYTNRYCYDRIKRLISNSVSEKVKVLPLDRRERFNVNRTLMKDSWVVLRYIAGRGDPQLDDYVKNVIVDLASKWRDSMASEEVDYGGAVEAYAKRLASEFKDEAEAAITEFMDNHMQLVVERDSVKVFHIGMGGRRLSFASVAARLHAETVRKTVIAVRYSTNIHYMVIAVPDEESVTASNLARALDNGGIIRRRIYDAGKRIFEGLISFKVKQGRIPEAIAETAEAAIRRGVD